MEVGRITQLTNVLTVFDGKVLTVKEYDDMFDLKDYKPEAPKEGGFEPFKYEGPVKFNYARVEKSEKESEFYKTPVGAKLFSIEMEVLAGDNKKRKFWRRWNLDTTVSDKKGKLPAQKLADQLFACGLEFTDEAGLMKCAEELVSSVYEIKAWSAKMPDKTVLQMWNLKGKAAEGWEDEEEPAGEVAF